MVSFIKGRFGQLMGKRSYKSGFLRGFLVGSVAVSDKSTPSRKTAIYGLEIPCFRIRGAENTMIPVGLFLRSTFCFRSACRFQERAQISKSPVFIERHRLNATLHKSSGTDPIPGVVVAAFNQTPTTSLGTVGREYAPCIVGIRLRAPSSSALLPQG